MRERECPALAYENPLILILDAKKYHASTEQIPFERKRQIGLWARCWNAQRGLTQFSTRRVRCWSIGVARIASSHSVDSSLFRCFTPGQETSGFRRGQRDQAEFCGRLKY